ncbi:hypothetical protein V8E54_014911 [Elaphomyces granulatus]
MPVSLTVVVSEPPCYAVNPPLLRPDRFEEDPILGGILNGDEADLHSFVSKWLSSISEPDDSNATMSHTDSDGFLVPSRLSFRSNYPSPRASRTFPLADDASSRIPSSNPSESRGRLISDPHYRRLNLAANHIFLRRPDQALPEHVSLLISELKRDRDCLHPSPEQKERLQDIEMGAEEGDVQLYFLDTLFTGMSGTGCLFQKAGHSDGLAWKRACC